MKKLIVATLVILLVVLSVLFFLQGKKIVHIPDWVERPEQGENSISVVGFGCSQEEALSDAITQLNQSIEFEVIDSTTIIIKDFNIGKITAQMLSKLISYKNKDGAQEETFEIVKKVTYKNEDNGIIITVSNAENTVSNDSINSHTSNISSNLTIMYKNCCFNDLIKELKNNHIHVKSFSDYDTWYYQLKMKKEFAEKLIEN